MFAKSRFMKFATSLLLVVIIAISLFSCHSEESPEENSFDVIVDNNFESISPEEDPLVHSETSARVERIDAKVQNGQSIYIFTLEGYDITFIAKSTVSVDLTITNVGDIVTIVYCDIKEEKYLNIWGFRNNSLYPNETGEIKPDVCLIGPDGDIVSIP